MRCLPSLFYPNLPLSVWSFFRDVGPLIAICVGGSLLAVLGYLTLAELLMRKRRRQQWLAQNRATLRKVMILGYFAGSLGRKLPACGNCGQSHYHLWHCGKRRVVYRCSHCKHSYSLSPFSHPEIRFIIYYLPALQVVQIWLNKYGRSMLGRHLLKLCKPVELYCRKRLLRP